MKSVSQLLLIAGLIPLVVALAVPNFKRLALGATQMFRPDAKPPGYDRSKIKRYIFWVMGISAAYAGYNLIVTRSSTEGWQYTGVEFIVTAAGLVTIILEKKQRDKRL